MATRFWEGGALAVAQISTVQITAFDAATTYIITIGGETVSVIGNTSVNQTATDLQVALDASTNPYFAAVTWTVATDTVTGTGGTPAGVPGVPFIATSSVTGGTGTIGAVTETTAPTGPNHWDDADNWSTNTVPVSTDDVIFRDNDTNVSFALDQNAVDLASLRIELTYTGKIGLNRSQFATSSDGDTTNSNKTEYRDTYLKIGSTLTDIGQHFGPGTPNGSSRIKINNDDGAGTTTTIIHGTASTTAETGLPAVRLLFDGAATHTVFVREAEAGIGIAVDVPGETATISKISISSGTVQLGEGVTVTTYEQFGGTNTVEAAATITTVTADAGSLQLEGDYTITTLLIGGSTVVDNHIKTGGDAVTTATITSGVYDLSGSTEARTIGTLNPDGGQVILDDSIVTVTTLDQPAGAVTLLIT